VEEERGKRHGKRSDSRALSSPDDAVTPDCPWFSANSSQQPGQSQSPNNNPIKSWLCQPKQAWPGTEGVSTQSKARDLA
jgi:hypothetical protein